MSPNELFSSDAVELLKSLPSESIDLVVTSPPYWSAVVYNKATKQCSGGYESYLLSLCERVLRPNGKLAINTPILPIPKSIIGDQHTRHIKNINNDIEYMIMSETELLRYSLFIWQKQTSKLMFGSYPYPGNLLENNTIEFINVFVKPGSPPKYPKEVKEANKLSREEWLDLTQQVWFMYPENVSRKSKHPAPFPLKLPARLIRLYTYGGVKDFPGDLVLDPFCGTGTTCVAAKIMNRRYLGIDICEEYIEMARERLESSEKLILMVGRPKYPRKEELLKECKTRGSEAKKQHKRKTYGRCV